MYLEMQVGTRKFLENILDPTQSPSMCLTVLDALKVSLLALNKAHKINVVNEPGGYQHTDMEVINTIQSLNGSLSSDHYGNLNRARRP